MNATERTPWIVRWTLRLEQATTLDRPVQAVDPTIRALFGTGTRSSVLRGQWLATRYTRSDRRGTRHLDLRHSARPRGGRDSAASAQRLVGVGLLAAGPTLWTGWAEWSAAGSTRQTGGPRSPSPTASHSAFTRRLGLRQRTARGRAAPGAAVSSVGAYLGGHLVEARKVASHHPAYDAALQA